MNDWSIDSELLQQLDERMQEGYKLSASIERAKVWTELWQDLKKVMHERGIRSVEDLDEAFDGIQSIYNWAMDFDMELHNAAIDDHSYNKIRIEFCEDYVSYSRDKLEQNVLELRRSAAETYFGMGNYEEGERQFASMMESLPTYGWGWIGWSDQYGLWAKNGTKDYEKATQLLLNALQVKDLDSRSDVLERLADVYKERGMKAEKHQTRQLLEKEMKTSSMNNARQSSTMQAPAISVKVGRNDPCTCGSGKKYKKCCG